MPTDRDGLLKALNQLAVIITDDSNDKQPPPPPDDVQLLSRARPPLAPLVFHLFSTMAKHWRCARACKEPHQAALALFTNRTLPANDDTSASFIVLLSRAVSPRLGARWQETCITVRDSLFVIPSSLRHVSMSWPLTSHTRPRPSVRVAFAEAALSNGEPVVDLCAMIKGNTKRLRLSVDGPSLFYQREEAEVQMKTFEKCQPVSFAKGFLENNTELNFEGKICLAVVLSYSFLDFCGKPWFPGGWTKDMLCLMQDGDSLFLRPFLVTNVLLGKGKPRLEVTARALAMKLLHHGILLLEIFQQDALRAPAHEPGKLPVDLKNPAEEWLRSTKWDVCERYRGAVEACISGELLASLDVASALSTARSRDEEFARLFCERVLAPLEADFVSQWHGQDPDRAMATLKLPSTDQGQNSSRARSAAPGVRTLQTRPGLDPKVAVQRLSSCPSRQIPPTTCQSRLPTSMPIPRRDEGRFFDTNDSPDSSE